MASVYKETIQDRLGYAVYPTSGGKSAYIKRRTLNVYALNELPLAGNVPLSHFGLGVDFVVL